MSTMAPVPDDIIALIVEQVVAPLIVNNVDEPVSDYRQMNGPWAALTGAWAMQATLAICMQTCRWIHPLLYAAYRHDTSGHALTVKRFANWCRTIGARPGLLSKLQTVSVVSQWNRFIWRRQASDNVRDPASPSYEAAIGLSERLLVDGPPSFYALKDLLAIAFRLDKLEVWPTACLNFPEDWNRIPQAMNLTSLSIWIDGGKYSALNKQLIDVALQGGRLRHLHLHLGFGVVGKQQCYPDDHRWRTRLPTRCHGLQTFAIHTSTYLNPYFNSIKGSTSSFGELLRLGHPTLRRLSISLLGSPTKASKQLHSRRRELIADGITMPGQLASYLFVDEDAPTAAGLGFPALETFDLI